jgi:hypothetical protein
MGWICCCPGGIRHIGQSVVKGGARLRASVQQQYQCVCGHASGSTTYRLLTCAEPLRATAGTTKLSMSGAMRLATVEHPIPANHG